MNTYTEFPYWFKLPVFAMGKYYSEKGHYRKSIYFNKVKGGVAKRHGKRGWFPQMKSKSTKNNSRSLKEFFFWSSNRHVKIKIEVSETEKVWTMGNPDTSKCAF